MNILNLLKNKKLMWLSWLLNSNSCVETQCQRHSCVKNSYNKIMIYENFFRA